MKEIKITEKDAIEIIENYKRIFKTKRQEHHVEPNEYIDWLENTLLLKLEHLIKLIQGADAPRELHKEIRRQFRAEIERIKKQKTKKVVAPIRYKDKHFKRIDALRKRIKLDAVFEIVAKDAEGSPDGLKQQYYERWYNKKVRRS